MKESELTIVGAGPGGLAAAIEAANAGIKVTLLDDNPKLGGQIYRQLEDEFVVTDAETMGRDYERGKALLREFNGLEKKVEVLNDAVVWGIFNDYKVAFVH